MDFIDRVNELSKRVSMQLDYCKTEEATKNALIMPFINTLGYDVFNPTEVMPEYTADVGIKRGEKVDYAIKNEGKPIIFFECKSSTSDLSKAHISQLHRYFGAVPDVRFGILTNGVEYRFYSDLDTQNVMDEKPFFTFDVLDFQDRQIDELKKFTKSTFDLEDILTTASELKYSAAIRRIIKAEFESPTEEFVRFFAKQVYSGILTQSVRDKFEPITKKALRSFLTETINQRLTSALQQQEVQDDVAELEESETEVVDKSPETRPITTTEEEIEGFFIVKSVLREKIDVKRIHMRDTKSYCGILLDDNNRKPICRLHFNRSQKYVGLFDGDAKDDRVAIENVDDLYQFADRILATINDYE